MKSGNLSNKTNNSQKFSNNRNIKSMITPVIKEVANATPYEANIVHVKQDQNFYGFNGLNWVQLGGGGGGTGDVTGTGTPDRLVRWGVGSNPSVILDSGVTLDGSDNMSGIQNLSATTFTSGIWNGDPIAIEYGGTGATDAPGARNKIGGATGASFMGLGPVAIDQFFYTSDPNTVTNAPIASHARLALEEAAGNQIVTEEDTQTLINKTINSADNTITFGNIDIGLTPGNIGEVLTVTSPGIAEWSTFSPTTPWKLNTSDAYSQNDGVTGINFGVNNLVFGAAGTEDSEAGTIKTRMFFIADNTDLGYGSFRAGKPKDVNTNWDIGYRGPNSISNKSKVSGANSVSFGLDINADNSMSIGLRDGGYTIESPNSFSANGQLLFNNSENICGLHGGQGLCHNDCFFSFQYSDSPGNSRPIGIRCAHNGGASTGGALGSIVAENGYIGAGTQVSGVVATLNGLNSCVLAGRDNYALYNNNCVIAGVRNELGTSATPRNNSIIGTGAGHQIDSSFSCILSGVNSRIDGEGTENSGILAGSALQISGPSINNQCIIGGNLSVINGLSQSTVHFGGNNNVITSGTFSACLGGGTNQINSSNRCFIAATYCGVINSGSGRSAILSCLGSGGSQVILQGIGSCCISSQNSTNTFSNSIMIACNNKIADNINQCLVENIRVEGTLRQESFGLINTGGGITLPSTFLTVVNPPFGPTLTLIVTAVRNGQKQIIKVENSDTASINLLCDTFGTPALRIVPKIGGSTPVISYTIPVPSPGDAPSFTMIYNAALEQWWEI